MSQGGLPSHSQQQQGPVLGTVKEDGVVEGRGEGSGKAGGGHVTPLSIHWGVALTPDSNGNQYSTTDVVSLDSIRSTLIRQVSKH